MSLTLSDCDSQCRAYGYLKGSVNLDSQELAEERLMVFFFATTNSLTQQLRLALEAVSDFEEVLALIACDCATMYERGMYVLPSEKHSLLKIMAFTLYLMDNTQGGKLTIYKHKLINVSRFDKIFCVRCLDVLYVLYVHVLYVCMCVCMYAHTHTHTHTQNTT
jgi:hypothetical protein